MTLTRTNGSADWALLVTCDAKAALGTHLSPGAGDAALFVSRGTGTLGEGNDALDVAPGPAVVKGESGSLSQEQSVSISEGGGQPRRDVVYLSEEFELAVEEGAEGPLDWGETVSESQENLSNAIRPAPPDMADIPGFPLATVLVTANAPSLSTGALDDLRAPAPLGNVRETAVEFESMATPGGRTNRVWEMDPTTEDFGSLMNDILESVADGSVIHVPPAIYDQTTGVEVNLPDVKIVGDGIDGAVQPDATPRVRKQADVVAFEGFDRMTIKGLFLRAQVSNTTSGIIGHERTTVRDCNIRSMGSHGIHIHQVTESNNPTQSVVDDVAVQYNDGSGVFLEENAGNPNTNAMKVSLRYARKNQGWAIDADGFGNRYLVQNFVGDGVGEGGIRVREGGHSNRAEVTYHEGKTRPTIRLDGNVNEAVVYRTGPNNYNLFEDNGTGNTKRQYTHLDMPEVQRGGTAHVEGLSVGIGAWEDLQNERAYETTYQNTTGGIKEVFVRAYADGSSGSQAIATTLKVAPTESFGSFPAGVADAAYLRDISSERTISVSAFVPDGHYYRVALGSSDESELNIWNERSWV
ncbi:hypothetical protein [Halococcus hamelinensis]|uniref:Uncharacterized protein n=1 Tax=Halococcus hamelinensis 100A6 TaxID=1132509 RepID=M0M1L6_9EURY|nr:hypothetical protein [Halococcus hamelinensis]EMA38479.1 hypothetical protein C447_10002 [Halococcus hamelinensis 100A6]